MSSTSVNDDLRMLRELAEEGRKLPLQGGAYLAWWGAVTSIGWALHYLLVTGQIDGAPSTLGWMWAGVWVFGYAGHLLLPRFVAAEAQTAGTAANHLQAAIWRYAGAVLVTFFLALALQSVLQGEASPQFQYSLSLVYAVYAIALATTGAISGNTVLQRAGLAAIAALAVLTLFSSSAAVWLAASAAVLLTMFIPGVLLMRQARSWRAQA